ncbi:nucleotidyltransferase family protein [Paenibacillus tengchongensis]|uniref:nucleotidyltransferase family protein n=1 Tax=Paenibacillus tengchongensis TaxID=2608684 RepID=UPI00124C6065|nr:nucleotidyltransferase family protein [Paenibacillus tengchongensis]
MEAATEILKKLALSFFNKNSNEIEKIFENNKVDWGVFIDQGIKHKMLPLIWHVFKDNPILLDQVPFYLKEFLSNNYLVNRHKTNLYYTYISHALDLLSENNIKFAAVKGIVLEKLIYDNHYIKTISDLDILIDGMDGDTVNELFSKGNVYLGKYDYLTNQISSHSRQQQLLFKLTKDHLSDYLISTGDDILPTVKIDVSTDYDWINRGSKNKFGEYLYSGVFELEINERLKIPVLNHAYHFLYIVLHLYRHAWSYRFIKRNISIRLSMFNDLLLYWLNFKSELVEEFPLILQDSSIYKQVSWVIYHTDQIFETDISKSLGLTVESNSINNAFGQNNGIIYWEGSIENRLWCHDEITLFKTEGEN